MGKRKKIDENLVTPEHQSVTDEKTSEANPPKYVVVRDGFRVSDREYDDPSNLACVNELKFWSKVEKNHSYGASVKTVVYDPKKHRTW